MELGFLEEVYRGLYMLSFHKSALQGFSLSADKIRASGLRILRVGSGFRLLQGLGLQGFGVLQGLGDETEASPFIVLQVISTSNTLACTGILFVLKV